MNKMRKQIALAIFYIVSNIMLAGCASIEPPEPASGTASYEAVVAIENVPYLLRCRRDIATDDLRCQLMRLQDTPHMETGPGAKEL